MVGMAAGCTGVAHGHKRGGLKRICTCRPHAHASQSLHLASMGVRVCVQVCRPYTHKLSFHPVTQEMTKMAFNSPKACIDIRKAKGTISSFFALKTQQQQGSSTAKGAAADAGSGGGQQAGTAGEKRSQQGPADEQTKDSKRQAL